MLRERLCSRANRKGKAADHLINSFAFSILEEPLVCILQNLGGFPLPLWWKGARWGL